MAWRGSWNSLVCVLLEFMESSLSATVPFLSSVALIIAAGLRFWQRRWEGYGIPALVVLLTITFWYVGDAIYNDYRYYESVFQENTLRNAWWQVALFVASLSFFVPITHRWMNKNLRSGRSGLLDAAERREIDSPVFQRRLGVFHNILLLAWVLLMVAALVRVRYDWQGLFFPWLGHKSEPWARNRIGSGFDALFSLAQYFQIFLTASFGVIAALSKDWKVRLPALVVCFLALPYFVFDRTRNVMLATMLPGFLSWVFLRLRGGTLTKATILFVAFLAVNSWFAFVLHSRSNSTIAQAFAMRETQSYEEKRHLGINMFEELVWINTFLENGQYDPKWGARYFAELVNPIPRSLWPEKPLIGIDYALLRGQGGASAGFAGVHATISTGMIGQGVVNFGRFFGPVAAAFLISCWVALLARQDLLARYDSARFLFYGLGLVLTFNMGRDITLLVIYPFVFGYLFYLAWTKFSAQMRVRATRVTSSPVGGVGRYPENGEAGGSSTSLHKSP